MPEIDQAGEFPDAAAIHEAVLANPREYPEGWVEQARFRRAHDLPPFRPPRFADGERIANVVASIRAEHGVSISFVAYDVERTGWQVEVDGEVAFDVDRYRDDAANTVVGLSSEGFRTRVEENL